MKHPRPARMPLPPHRGRWQPGDEGQEVLLSAGWPAGGDGLSRMNVQGCDKRLGSMPDMLEFLAAEGSRPSWPVQMFARDGLHHPSSRQSIVRPSFLAPCVTGRRSH